MMSIDLKWMQYWFAQFNHLYFNDQLPTPTFRIGKSRTQLGSFSWRRRVSWRAPGITEMRITLSCFYKQSEDAYKNTLLHEMIHLYVACSGKRDTSSHGVIFRQKMLELNQKYGWHITISSRRGTLEVADGFKNSWKLILLLTVDRRGCFFAVVNPSYAQKLKRQLQQVPNLQESAWFVSNDAFFSKYPAVRSLRAFKIGADEYERFKLQLKPFAV